MAVASRGSWSPTMAPAWGEAELPWRSSATPHSKLGDGAADLMHISTLGFRGEALPSIGAVARLTIAARLAGEDQAWAIAVDAGVAEAPAPAPCAFAGPHGARVEIRDLFFATPARLKFMEVGPLRSDGDC